MYTLFPLQSLLLYYAVASTAAVQTMLARDTCPCKIDNKTRTANCANQQLGCVPDCVPDSTEKLNLTNNEITELRPRGFQRFQNLTRLIMSFNYIAVMPIDVFHGISKLKHLDLSSGISRMGSLNGSYFNKLPNLQKLLLPFNNLFYISEDVFKGLLNLKFLSLEFNNLEYFSGKLFQELASLKVLILDKNNLYHTMSLPVEIFQPLHSLQELHISGICPPQKNCTYRDEQLSKIPSLKKLYMDGLPNQTFGNGFALLRNLEELYLETYWQGYCYLRNLKRQTFQAFRNTSLSKLVMPTCEIDTIEPYTFEHLRNLRTLDLSFNPNLCEAGLYNLTSGLNTTSITNLTVAGICKELRSWFLSPGDLKGIQATNLEILDLSKGTLFLIRSELFQHLPKTLKHFYVQENYIAAIDLHWIKELNNLISFNISKQKNLVSETSVINGSSLYVDVDKQDSALDRKVNAMTAGRNINSLTQKTKFRARKSITPFNYTLISKRQKPPVLSRLVSDLQNRSAQVNSTIWCVSLPSTLVSIDLSYSELLESILPCESENNLKSFNTSHQKKLLPVKTLLKKLRNMRFLENLDISGNRIKTLAEDVFSSLTALKYLTISNNDLIDVSFGLNQFKDLRTLDLSDNKIQYASKAFTEELELVASRTGLVIHLEGNALICDCHHIEFTAWLRYTNTIYNKDTLMCKYENGSQVSLRRISHIHNRLLDECIATKVLVGCIVGFFILLLLLLLIWLAYYKRWQLRYLVYIGRRRVNPYHPLEEAEVEFDYDIYISYERDDIFNSDQTIHEFVTEKVYPMLKNCGFRVLIREELDAGKPLYHSIPKALRKARSVVVLLSREYCKEYWNIFEFNISVLEGLYTKREVVIPVILDNLVAADLHDEVYTYLKSDIVPVFPKERNVADLIDHLAEKAMQ